MSLSTLALLALVGAASAQGSTLTWNLTDSSMDVRAQFAADPSLCQGGTGCLRLANLDRPKDDGPCPDTDPGSDYRGVCGLDGVTEVEIVGDSFMTISTGPGSGDPKYGCGTVPLTIRQPTGAGKTLIEDGCTQTVECGLSYVGEVRADAQDNVGGSCRHYVRDGKTIRDPYSAGSGTSPGTCGGSCSIPAKETRPDQGVAPSKTAPDAALDKGRGPGATPAKLQIRRAQVRNGRLDVLAPITRRASGKVEVSFRAAGRTTRFGARVDSRRGYVRFKHRLPNAQQRKGTGIVILSYPGDADTRPDEVRLRAASGKAKLTAERPTVKGDRLRAAGTVSSKARGVVRIRYVFTRNGQPELFTMRAKVNDGRWKAVSTRLPPEVMDGGQSTILYTGYLPRRLRGEMRSYAVRSVG